MSDKKEARELTPEEMEERGYDQLDELLLDLERGTQALTEEATDRVEQAREGFLQVVGLLTCHVPAEPSMEHTEGVWKLCKSAMMFRNIVRAEFMRADGYTLPEFYEEAQEGTVH